MGGCASKQDASAPSHAMHTTPSGGYDQNVLGGHDGYAQEDSRRRPSAQQQRQPSSRRQSRDNNYEAHGSNRSNGPSSTGNGTRNRPGSRSDAEPRSQTNQGAAGSSARGNAERNGNGNGNNDRRVRRNETVDFVDFKDKEKNVVEMMLNSNKGLRMAEINFHDLKLQKIIGAGAFGEVIKGTYCGTPVVVKRMLRNKIKEDNLRMFGDEIQLMMNLRHPNIVQVTWRLLWACWSCSEDLWFCLLAQSVYRRQLELVLEHVSAWMVV
jgi:hypothetical protein